MKENKMDDNWVQLDVSMAPATAKAFYHELRSQEEHLEQWLHDNSYEGGPAEDVDPATFQDQRRMLDLVRTLQVKLLVSMSKPDSENLFLYVGISGGMLDARKLFKRREKAEEWALEDLKYNFGHWFELGIGGLVCDPGTMPATLAEWDSWLEVNDSQIEGWFYEITEIEPPESEPEPV